MSGETDLETSHGKIPSGKADGDSTTARRSKRLQSDFGVGTRQALIAEAIRLRALPGLLARHADLLGQPSPRITSHDVEGLADLIADAEEQHAEAFLALIAARGMVRLQITEDLLGPAAVTLGKRWDADLCSATDVTLGVSRLVRLLHSNVIPQHEPVEPRPLGRVLVASLPGDWHTLGAAILEDGLRSFGWDVSAALAPRHGQIEERLASRSHDAVALSVTDQGKLSDVAPLIRTMRQQSVEAGLVVILGGQAVIGPAEAQVRFGADAVTHTTRGAHRALSDLLRMKNAASEPLQIYPNSSILKPV